MAFQMNWKVGDRCHMTELGTHVEMQIMGENRNNGRYEVRYVPARRHQRNKWVQPNQIFPSQMLKRHATWTSSEIAKFIALCDPSLEVHSAMMIRHNLDGTAIPLVDAKIMVEVMAIPLGDALKIRHVMTQIQRLP